jgi:hypothetical protein
MSTMGQAFPVGARVRVTKSVVVYTHPDHRGQPHDLIGAEGEVVSVLQEWQERPVSANLPYIVKFTSKFKAHFQAGELEQIE